MFETGLNLVGDRELDIVAYGKLEVKILEVAIENNYLGFFTEVLLRSSMRIDSVCYSSGELNSG